MSCAGIIPNCGACFPSTLTYRWLARPGLSSCEAAPPTGKPLNENFRGRQCAMRIRQPGTDAVIRSGLRKRPRGLGYPLLALGVRLLVDPGPRSWSYADRSRSRGGA